MLNVNRACGLMPLSAHSLAVLQVLEGYIYLGGTARLGEEVMHAYASAVDTAVLKTVRSILIARAGLEGRVKGAGILQELIKLLPADLFRVCLARVGACLPQLTGLVLCACTLPADQCQGSVPGHSIAQMASCTLCWPAIGLTLPNWLRPGHSRYMYTCRYMEFMLLWVTGHDGCRSWR